MFRLTYITKLYKKNKKIQQSGIEISGFQVSHVRVLNYGVVNVFPEGV